MCTYHYSDFGHIALIRRSCFLIPASAKEDIINEILKKKFIRYINPGRLINELLVLTRDS
jgi:hypothetical protein